MASQENSSGHLKSRHVALQGFLGVVPLLVEDTQVVESLGARGVKLQEGNQLGRQGADGQVPRPSSRTFVVISYMKIAFSSCPDSPYITAQLYMASRYCSATTGGVGCESNNPG